MARTHVLENYLVAATSYFASILMIWCFWRLSGSPFRWSRLALYSGLVPLGAALTINFPWNWEPYIFGKILQLQQPDLFAHDLYFQSTKVASPYNSVSTLFHYFPFESIQSLFFGLYLGCWLSIVTILDVLSHLLLPKRATPYVPIVGLALLGLTIRFYEWGGFVLGDNDLLYMNFKNQTLAFAVALWALVFYFKSRFASAGLFLGFATLLHLHAGLHVLPLIAVDLLIFRKDAYRPFLVRFVPIYGALCTLALLPFLSAEFQGASGLMTLKHEFVHIAGHFRHPHHMVPSTWPLRNWLLFVSMLVAFALLLRGLDVPTRVRRRIGTIVLVCLAGVGVGFIFVDVIPMDLICKLQLFRMTLFIKFLFIFILSWFLIDKLGRTATLTAIAGLTLSFGFFRTTQIELRQSPLPVAKQMLDRHTEKDDVIVIPPWWGHSMINSFLVDTQRSTFVDMSRFPFAKGYTAEWFIRIALTKGLLIEEELRSNPSVDKNLVDRVKRTDWPTAYAQLGADVLCEIRRRSGSKTFVLRPNSAEGRRPHDSLILIDADEHYQLLQISEQCVTK